MASISSALPAPHRSRLRSFVWPREHGAWGLLLVPLATGAGVACPGGERIAAVLLFAVAALGLFCLRTPVEAWLGISPMRPQNDVERGLIHHSIYAYASVAGLALAVLLAWTRAFGLLLVGAAAASAFLLQVIWKRLGRGTRRNAPWMGALALTSTAAGAYYLASGHFDRTAAVLWAANWLFALNQIHFVQLRIHSARALTSPDRSRQGRSFLLHQAACLLALAAAWRAGWIPGLALLAFGPALLRGLAWFLAPPRPLAVHRLGVSELLNALVFGAVLVAGYTVHIQ